METGKGFKLIVHLPNEIPTFFHKPLFIDLNVSKLFKINAIVRKTSSEMRGYRPEIRRCYFEGEKKLKFFKSYTKALCDFECMTNYTLEQCGCVKFNMPREPQTKVCDFDKLDCYFAAAQDWTTNTNCNCLKPCTYIEYSVDLVKEINDHEEMTDRDLSHSGFLFAKQTIEEHTSYVAYSIQNFVADCGGLIGLFFELVCNLITLVMRKWRNRSQH
jgi:amiloride-sensitive sodium channel